MSKEKNDFELAAYVGDKIKYYRKQKRLTQKELAQRIKKSDNTVSNYEKAIITPSQDALFALAEALDVSIDDFFPERKTQPSLHEALQLLNKDLDVKDIHFFQNVMNYVSSLDESSKAQLLNNIDFAVKLFKNEQ